jgi:hypothetical protein
MQRTKYTMTKIAASLLLASAPMGAALAQGGDWDWSLAPYLWLPAIGSDVDVDVPPIDLGGTSQVSEWAPKLGFTIPLHLEGQGDDFGLLSDLLYLPLSDKRDREGRLFSTDSSFHTGIFELAAVWSPGENRHEGFEAFGGLRYIWASLDLKLIPNDTALPGGKISLDKSFADVLLGGRYTARLSDRWALTMRGDGSFGSTDNTYGASALFSYATDSGAWIVGYRYMKLKFSDNNAALDLKLYGPEFGYNFRF